MLVTHKEGGQGGRAGKSFLFLMGRGGHPGGRRFAGGNRKSSSLHFIRHASVPPPQQRRNTEMPDDTPFAHLFLCSLPRVHHARGPSPSDGPRSRHPGSPPLPRPRIVNHVTSAHGGLMLGELTFLVSHARRRCCDGWRSTRDRRQRKASELIHGNLLGWRDL